MILNQIVLTLRDPGDFLVSKLGRMIVTTNLPKI